MIHNKAVDGEAQILPLVRCCCDTASVTNHRSACQFMSTSIDNRDVQGNAGRRGKECVLLPVDITNFLLAILTTACTRSRALHRHRGSELQATSLKIRQVLDVNQLLLWDP